MTRRTRTRREPAGGRLIVPSFPGVTPDLWTETPPAAYPPEVAELIRGVLDARSTGEIVTVNGWACDTCASILVARDLHPGVVPAVIDHNRFVIGHLCPGLARSLNYPRHVDLGPPSHEWYRPSEPALLALGTEPGGDRFINHVLRGGLLLRPIPQEQA